MINSYKLCFFIFLGLFLCGCSTQPSQSTATPTHVQADKPAAETATQQSPTETKSPVAGSPLIVLDDQGSNDPIDPIPNLWTRIDKDKITIHPADRKQVSDYAYEKNGGVWVVGSFGVIHQDANGKRTWYSMKNGLPNNSFSTVVISPKNEVWIGGANNALLRFDGVGWVDEGFKLPAPQDSNTSWLCYSKNIIDIDFDQNGAAWVMNGGIELYALAYGEWVNFPFPKDILPNAGGGACPQGIRVKSENDITIKRNGCCSNPAMAYHYDGKTWSWNSDFAAVDAQFAARHTPPNSNSVKLIDYDDYKIWLSSVSKGKFLPNKFAYHLASGDMNPQRVLMATDQNNIIWIYGIDVNGLYNNATGTFKAYQPDYDSKRTDAEAKNSNLLNFGSTVFYAQDGKNLSPLWTALYQFGIWQDPQIWGLLQFPGIDSQNRVWVYHHKNGLLMLDNGKIQSLAQSDPELDLEKTGGVLPLHDGRILVGSFGAFWMYDGKGWQKWVLPHKTELLSSLGEDQQGMVYAATDTGVYKIDLQNKHYSINQFVIQNAKPLVVAPVTTPQAKQTGGCTFPAHYNTSAICHGVWTDPAMDAHYILRLFSFQDDGTVYYVNNKVIARFKDGLWKSFFFNTFDIEAATIDKDKAVWIYTEKDGLIQFAPNLFDEN